MGYGFVTLIRSGGNLAVTEGVLFERGLLSPAAHMAWTGLAAAAVWQAASAGWPGRLAGRALGVFVLVVALHTAWDAAGSLVVYLVVALVSLGLLVVTAHSLAAPHRRELPSPERLSLGLRR
jgi:RsiW-degrading membrane proteinase PrsW (M82 family)